MKSYNTAISRKTMSAPTKHLLNRGRIVGGTILDYGCGKGKDVEELKAMGYKVTGYDPHFYPNLPIGKFDIIIMNYVLNIIETPNSRPLIMRSAFELLNNGGVLYISCRNKKDINTASGEWYEHNDGFLTKKYTFQAGIDYDDLYNYFLKSGIAGVTISNMSTSKFTMVALKK